MHFFVIATVNHSATFSLLASSLGRSISFPRVKVDPHS
jgi:hypothetical protein